MTTATAAAATAAWVSSPMPAVVIPSAIGAELAAELVARLEEDAGYTRYALLDRGSYDVIENSRLVTVKGITDLLGTLAGIAAGVTGRERGGGEGEGETVDIEARVMRLRPGDYCLVRNDRVYDDRPLELVLDLSAMPPVTGAEVHWRHRGQVFFTMPSEPGALAIVERGPTVMCNHTYVSKRWTNASIIRLIAILR